MTTRKLPKRADNGQITTKVWVKKNPDHGYLQTIKKKKKS